MPPLFLPRIAPLPPFDAAVASTSTSSRHGGYFDAVAEAEEALEAQVREQQLVDVGGIRGDEFIFLRYPLAPFIRLSISYYFSLDRKRRVVSNRRHEKNGQKQALIRIDAT